MAEDVASVVLAIAGYGIYRALAHFGPWILGAIKPWYGRLLATAGLFGFGLLLYAFRCRRLRYYGSVEVLVGVYACWKAVEKLSQDRSPEIWLTVVAGAVYLVVRGLDNRAKGIKDENDKRAAAVAVSVSSATHDSRER